MDDIKHHHSDDLINASRVKGTKVYDTSGESIGTVDEIVLTKRGGEVAYAVMSFGGFLGIGEKYHPLPWDALDYDVNLGGYVVGGVGESFREAPSYSRDEFDHGGWTQSTDEWYDEATVAGRIRRRQVGQGGAMADIRPIGVREPI